MMDRLERLYPSVDQTITALPTGWSAHDKDPNIGVSHTNLKLTYRGTVACTVGPILHQPCRSGQESARRRSSAISSANTGVVRRVLL